MNADSEVRIDLTSMLDLEVASKEVIDEDKKKSSISYYSGYNNYSSYNEESDLRTVYFYEFSDTTRNALIFTKVSEFMSWAKEHNIMISSYTETTLKKQTTSFCTCRKGASTIIVRTSKWLLDEAMKDNDCNQSTTVPSHCYPDYGYDYYNDWD